MLKTYTYPKFAYVQPEEQKNRTAARYPVVIVGAGPVGLTAALDCHLEPSFVGHRFHQRRSVPACATWPWWGLPLRVSWPEAWPQLPPWVFCC